MALVLHWLPLQRLRCLFLGNWMPPKVSPVVVVALALHWLAIQTTRLLTAMLEIHFLRLLSVLGRFKKNDQREGRNLARSFCGATVVSLLRDSLFDVSSVLRWFHFGRPECLNVLFFQCSILIFILGFSSLLHPRPQIVILV